VQPAPRIGYGGANVASPGDDTPEERAGLFALTLLALAVGALAGALGAAFRLALAAGDGWRNAFVAWAHGYAWVGLPMVAGTTASFFSPLTQYGLGPEGASSLLLPRIAGYQRAFSLLVMGRAMSAEEARSAGLVNVVVPPGHAIVEAQKAAREICALSPEAVAISRKLLKPPTEDLLRRMGQEEHLFAERIRSPSVLAAIKSFLSRKKR